MAKKVTEARPARPTLSDQLARQHELLMATLTKPARLGSQMVEFGERATGADAGNVYVKNLTLVQHDGEEDVQFLGRQERTLRDVITMLAGVNADKTNPAKPAGGEDA